MTAGAADVRDETVEVWDSRLRLHVKVAGHGPPLLFFHPLSGLAWPPLLDRLAQAPHGVRAGASRHLARRPAGDRAGADVR